MQAMYVHNEPKRSTVLHFYVLSRIVLHSLVKRVHMYDRFDERLQVL